MNKRAFERRYIIVGDVHGNWREVEDLLKKALYEPAADRIIFVGDYNDHFSYTDCSVYRLIDLLLELRESSPDGIFFVRGNHDLWFANWLSRGGVPLESWYFQGGRETLASYGIADEPGSGDGREKIPTSHQDFICNLVDQYYLDDHVVVVHGGFTSEKQMQLVAQGRRLNDGDLEEIVWDRHFIFTEDDTDHALFLKYFGGRYLITGHTQEGPYVNPRNPKWILIETPGRGENLRAVVIEDEHDYRFIRAD